LSFLGTTNYTPAAYGIPDAGPPTPFTQVAIANHVLAARPGLPLTVRVFTTGQAAERNWTPPDRPGLRDALQGLEGTVDVANVPIPNGDTDGELWAIFQAIVDNVEPGDHLYVDVTHGFRSLPVLLTKALDYVVQAKDAVVERLDYGAWTFGREDAAMIDLRSFLVIDEWARAVATYRHGGDLIGLATTIDREVVALKRAHRAAFPASLGRLPSKLLGLAHALEHCRLDDIPGLAAEVTQALEEGATSVQSFEGLRPLGPLLTALDTALRPMAPLSDAPADRIRAQLASAAYHLERERYLNGYTLLRETLVGAVALYAQRLGAVLDRKEVDATAFGALAAPKPPPRSSPLASALAERPWSQAFRKAASAVVDTRNRLDHAGTGDTIPKPANLARFAERDVAATREAVEALLTALDQEPEAQTPPAPSPLPPIRTTTEADEAVVLDLFGRATGDVSALYREEVFALACERMRRHARTTAPVELALVPVGTQPYAPILAALATDARRVVLLHTPPTAAYAEEARVALLADRTDIRLAEIGDGTEPERIARVVLDEVARSGVLRPLDVLIDVTGGRKSTSSVLGSLAAVHGFRQAYVEGTPHPRHRPFHVQERVIELPNVRALTGGDDLRLALVLLERGDCEGALEHLTTPSALGSISPLAVRLQPLVQALTDGSREEADVALELLAGLEPATLAPLRAWISGEGQMASAARELVDGLRAQGLAGE
ncbi:MAG: CRISPR-associated DxTHG motif protein, partial [Myxococcales bacterium]|nr:CRISPR-associated DxTHG motif protein [Myxococcales bacterium]